MLRMMEASGQFTAPQKTPISPTAAANPAGIPSSGPTTQPNVAPMKKLGTTPDEMTTILNRKSGFMGLSGKTSDCRDLNELANAGDPKAKLVLHKLTYDIIKNIGQYAAAMNGVDLICFAGGIGEHNSRLRRRVLENFSYLGLKVDYEANQAFEENAIITTPDSAVKAALICTNEELVIARDTMHIVQGN